MAAALEDRKQRVSISALWNGTGTAPTGSVVTVSSPGGSVLAIEITGTFTATIQFEGTIDETTWFAITGIPAAGGAGVTSATAAGRWFFQYAGLRAARVRAGAYTSGTPIVTMNVGAGSAGGGASSSGSSTVQGNLTNNNAAPAANNLGVLPAIANAVSPAYVEGDQVLLSTNLSGQLRTLVQGYQAAASTIAQNPVPLGIIHSDNKIQHLFNAPGNVNADGTNLPGAADFRFAVAYGADPFANTAARYAAAICNRHGIPFAIGGHPNVKTFAQNYTGAQTDAAVVTIATGNKIVVTSIMVKCHNTNTVNVSARVGFGTANVPAYGNAGLLLTDPGIAPGSGSGRGNGAGIIGVGADDEDLRVTLSVPTGGSADLMVSYFVVPS